MKILLSHWKLRNSKSEIKDKVETLLDYVELADKRRLSFSIKWGQNKEYLLQGL